MISKIKTRYQTHSPLELLEYFLFLSGPFMAIIGNAISDIYLIITALYLLIKAIITKDFSPFNQAWFFIAILFVLWSFFTAFISINPDEAIFRSLTFVRFPLYAALLSTWLAQKPHRLEAFAYLALLGSLIVLSFILYEKIMSPGLTRPYGPWNQHMKIGWYFYGFAFPATLYFLMRVKIDFDIAKRSLTTSALIALSMIGFMVFSIFMSGMIYLTMAMCAGLGLFLLLSMNNSKGFIQLVITMIMLVLIVILVYLLAPEVIERFIFGFTNRLPWMVQSDYYDPWITGLYLGLENPISGVGAGNFEEGCRASFSFPEDFGGHVQYCFGHPHNLYLQYASETGILGAVLFLIIAILMLVPIFKVWKMNFGMADQYRAAYSLSLIIIVFLPLSTYSDAFGQHANFFSWTIVVFALAQYKIIAKCKYI